MLRARALALRAARNNGPLARLASPLCSAAPTPDAHDASDGSVLRTLHRVSKLLKHEFVYPRIVMVGEQSSGKTSVLEALMGASISVTDSTMATRRPLMLNLFRLDDPAQPMYAEFDDGEVVHTWAGVKDRIRAENAVTGADVSAEPIGLTLYSPNFADTTIIDLPGYTQIADQGQSRELPEQIEALNGPYLADERNILCVVQSAVTDPATSRALRMVQSADPESLRSLGVVTKMDLISKSHSKDALVRLLQNSTHPLGLGRIGVRCRTHQEQLDGADFASVRREEAKWIKESGLTKVSGVRLGVPKLRASLSDLLIGRIASDLPAIISRLDEKIATVRSNQTFLAQLASEPDLRTVSRELEGLVNGLHPASDARHAFEQRFRQELFSLVQTQWNRAADGAFSFEGLEPTKETSKGVPVMSLAADTLRQLSYDPDAITNIAGFREFLVYGGEAQLDNVSQKELTKMRNRAMQIGAVTGFFDHSLPPKPRQMRTRFSKGVARVVDALLDDDDSSSSDAAAAAAAAAGGEGKSLVDESFDLFLKEILSFSETIEVSGSKQGRLARQYFKFLLERISQRIQDSSLRTEMIGMILRERRPVADFLDIQNELSKAKHYPQAPSFFYQLSNPRQEITMFNEDWVAAYSSTAQKRVSDDLFRIMTVRLLEPLVFEAIQYSLTLFSKGAQVSHEAKRESDLADELEELSLELKRIRDRYGAPRPAQ